MTICDDASHDEIVFVERQAGGGRLQGCPACRLVEEISRLEKRVKELEDAE